MRGVYYARERTCIWIADATRVLHEFACWCATQAIDRQRTRGVEPDPRSIAAIQAKLDWLDGKITESQLAAAESAAWSAAESAAWSAAESAARSVAWSAARSVAWSATESAAWSAAWSAQNAELERRLLALAPQAEVPA